MRTSRPNTPTTATATTDVLLGNGTYRRYRTDYVRRYGAGRVVRGDSVEMVMHPYGYFDGEGQVRYYLHDFQGNVTMVVDNEGKVLQHTRYYPYGEPIDVFAASETSNLSPTSDRNQPFLYGGKELERMHGLGEYDYGARRLQSHLPMWTTQDPCLEKYFPTSPYAYCAANPIRFTDPTGCDKYEINNNGEIVNKIPNNKKDILTLVDKGQSLELKKGVIREWKRIDNSKHRKRELVDNSNKIENNKCKVIDRNSDPNHPTIDYLKIQGDENGRLAYEFLCDGLKDEHIEFTMIMTGLKGDSGLVFIGTAHLEFCDNSHIPLFNDMLRHNFNIRLWFHNHSLMNPPNFNDQRLCRELRPYSQKLKEPIIWGVYIPGQSGVNGKYYEYGPTTNLKNCRLVSFNSIYSKRD